ncbi:MAG: DUF4968 domain-containing protein, partial [Prevotella sp.]|nr:DUF4968 domain-containing protein [Prevotella sp.]
MASPKTTTMLKNIICTILLCCGLTAQAAVVETKGQMVTIRPDGGEARVVCLQVMNDRIIRVRATSEANLPKKPKSLIVVKQTTKPRFEVKEDENTVYVKAAEVQAAVDKQTGAVHFFDEAGKKVLGETRDGKRFWPYRVPAREIGVDSSKVNEEQRKGLTWQLTFGNRNDALYGLGQHQSE